MATEAQKKLREEWLVNLETGKINGIPYKKGFNQLQDKDGGFCCLGVAQKMIGGAVDGYTDLSSTTEAAFGFLCNREPLIKRNDGRRRTYYKKNGLRSEKRTQTLSHKRIAAWVRANPEKVWAD
jgi:hypothetical protein